jgi:hypothetical protein
MKKYNVFSATDLKGVSRATKAGIFFCCIFFLMLFLQSAHGAMVIRIPGKGDNGGDEEMDLYRGSYALLIGASAYRAGWPSLESIPGELDNVEDLLVRKGFKVERVRDPDSQQLQDAFIGFINRYGYDRNNRLLFF